MSIDWNEIRNFDMDSQIPEVAKVFFQELDVWLEVRGYSDEVASEVLGVSEKMLRLMKEKTLKSESGRKATPNVKAIGKMVRRMTIDYTKEMVGDDGPKSFFAAKQNDDITQEDFERMMGNNS